MDSGLYTLSISLVRVFDIMTAFTMRNKGHFRRKAQQENINIYSLFYNHFPLWLIGITEMGVLYFSTLWEFAFSLTVCPLPLAPPVKNVPKWR